MIKELYPLLTNTTYLNTAYVGLMSTQLAEFRRRHEESFVQNGGDQYKIEAYEALGPMQQNVASFFGLSPDRFFGTANFSSGIRTALSLLPKNLKVLLIDEDYPSLSNAIEEQNFFHTSIPMQVRLEEAIEEKLKTESVDVLALSIVQYTSGLLIDQNFLKRIKKEYPHLILVGDGTQFLGAHEFHFDESPFDLVSGSGYKWLLAGFGNGLVMLSETFVNKTGLSKNKIRDRFFQGHFNILGLASLNFAIEQLDKQNFQGLMRKKATLSQEAKVQLTDSGFLSIWVEERPNHSSIFNIKGDEILFEFLQRKNIRTVVRGSGVRISFHFYNTEKDLEHLLKALQEFKNLNGNFSLD